MMRGTTPTVEFKLPFSADILQKLWVTFSQNDTEKFTLTKDDVIINDNKIICKLSQLNTLSLNSGCKVEMQIRGLTNDNIAVGSKIISSTPDRILKDGEI